MKSINILVKKSILGHKKGQAVEVLTDMDGTPISKFWRDRIKDSESDGCVKILNKKQEDNK